MSKNFFPFPLCSDHDWATRLSLIRGALMALSVYLWYMLVCTFKVTLDFQVGYIGDVCTLRFNDFLYYFHSIFHSSLVFTQPAFSIEQRLFH